MVVVKIDTIIIMLLLMIMMKRRERRGMKWLIVKSDAAEPQQ